MSCISFMNGITKVHKETHSNALSLLVYILDTRVLIYYEYLYGAIDVYGPWWHSHKWEWGHMFYHLLKLLAPQNIKLQNYIDQLKSMSMWVTNQNTMGWIQS